MRTPILAANWKMNLTPQQAVEFAEKFTDLVGETSSAEIVVAPTFLALPAVAEKFATTPVAVAAQNCHSAESGAFTGEISAPMLQSIGADWVILGHSERRTLFAETDSLINQKVHAVLAAKLKPILCIGETLEERDQGLLEQVLTTQLTEGLKDITATQLADFVLAYEPVWAIGTGRTATPEQAQQAHALIRSILTKIADADTAAKVRIQYGGSVKPANAKELLAQEDIDGALVGGASLDPETFFAICNATTPSSK